MNIYQSYSNPYLIVKIVLEIIYIPTIRKHSRYSCYANIVVRRQCVYTRRHFHFSLFVIINRSSRHFTLSILYCGNTIISIIGISSENSLVFCILFYSSLLSNLHHSNLPLHFDHKRHVKSD